MERPNYTLEELKAEPHYSYSALNTYLNICQLQYFYRYVEKRESERTPVALPFGSAFHSVMSEIAGYAKKGELPRNEAMKDAFVEYFKGFCATSPDVTYKKDENEGNASPKQIDYLLKLMKGSTWTVDGIKQSYNLSRLEDLTSEQASYLINQLKANAA